jgi:uncharacterized SAM-binding protein YcdF (DUF218 family)
MDWMKRLLFGAMAAGLAGFVLFIRALPLPGETPPPVLAGDGIVVPTGGYARVATGLDLLAASDGHLLITGVRPSTPLSSVLAETERSAPGCCVELDYDAGNTAGNAVAAQQWVTQHGLQRIHLVTSWYHMPRSLLLFRRAMPGITVIPHPVFPAKWSRHDWWLDASAWRFVVIEYVKYIWAYVPFAENRKDRG